MGTYGKHIENIRFAWESMKTQGQHKCCVGTNGKRKENKGFTLEPMEN